MSRRMFVSYAREDLDVVTGLAADLQATGHRFAWDPWSTKDSFSPSWGGGSTSTRRVARG